MLPVRRQVIDAANKSTFELMEKRGLGKTNTQKSVKCPKCRRVVPLTEEKIKEGFVFCHCPEERRPIKLSDGNIIANEIFEFSPNGILNHVQDLLNKLGFKHSKHDNYWFVEVNSKQIPVFCLGLFAFHNYLQYSRKSSALVFCLDPKDVTEYSTIYSEYNFIPIAALFTDPKPIELVNKKLISIAKTFKQNEILGISEKIKEKQRQLSDNQFEIFCKNIFSEISKNPDKTEDFLEYLKRFKDTPTAAKYVHIGGNYPSDFVSIPLFDYFSQLLKPEGTKTYEVKRYAITTPFTISVFDDKLKTNRGKRVLFFVPHENIANEV